MTDNYREQLLECLRHLQRTVTGVSVTTTEYSHGSVCDIYRGQSLVSVTSTEDSHSSVCDSYRGQSPACLWWLRYSDPPFFPWGCMVKCERWWWRAFPNLLVKDGGEGHFPTIPLWSKTDHVQHLGPDHLLFIKARKWLNFKMKKWIMFIFVRLNLYGCCQTDQWASYFSWNKLYFDLLGLVWNIGDLTMAWKSKWPCNPDQIVV